MSPPVAPSGVDPSAGLGWALFVDWCTATGLAALPADRGTITAFLAEMPTGRSSRSARLAAIRRAHASAGLADRIALPSCTFRLIRCSRVSSLR